MKNQVFIYLARRDKKGIKTLFNFSYKTKIYPTKISNIENLQFNNEIKNSLYVEVDRNKSLYELYIESANSFNDLKKSLKQRGYKNLPLQQINMKLLDVNQNINENFVVTKNATMLRKKSDQA
jgi:hypothetical protein